jgi:hypothetical protein
MMAIQIKTGSQYMMKARNFGTGDGSRELDGVAMENVGDPKIETRNSEKEFQFFNVSCYSERDLAQRKQLC